MSAQAQSSDNLQQHALAGDEADEAGFFDRVRAGEAVCELWPIRDGEVIDAARQCMRLARLAEECAIVLPMGDELLLEAVAETAQREGHRDGLVQLRLERGADGAGVLHIAVSGS